MAIQAFTIADMDELVSVVASLGWFASVTNESGTLTAKDADSKTLLEISFGTGGHVYFYPRGKEDYSSLKVDCTMGGTFSAGYKTRNGLLLLYSMAAPTNTAYSYLLIGKTNNGKIAVCGQSSAGTANINRIKTGAGGETSGNLNSDLYLGTIGSALWSDTSQVVPAPIPTHPLNGTSYIVCAKLLLVFPSMIGQIVEIDGVQYATNGKVALSDEVV